MTTLVQVLLEVAAFNAWVLFLSFVAGPAVGHLNWRQAHHGYWGLALVLAGFACVLAGWYWLGVAMMAAGNVVLADDTVQHAVQRFGERPEWKSPGHRAYGWAWRRWAWVRAVNEWADRWLA